MGVAKPTPTTVLRAGSVMMTLLAVQTGHAPVHCVAVCCGVAVQVASDPPGIDGTSIAGP